MRKSSFSQNLLDIIYRGACFEVLHDNIRMSNEEVSIISNDIITQTARFVNAEIAYNGDCAEYEDIADFLPRNFYVKGAILA